MADIVPGLLHTAPNGSIAHISLQKVRINIFIVDVSARVTLRQSFINTSTSPTSRAKYVFPVPARAAVCAFEMHFADGRVVKGEAKDDAIAAAEYEHGMREGRTAALVEFVKNDVFTISVGSIPAGEPVSTKITFVMDLMDDEYLDEVRLHLPMSIGQRYGRAPLALSDALYASPTAALRITAEIQTSAPITNVHSPSHSVIINPYITSTGVSSRRRKTVAFRSKSFLDDNFVLVIQAEGLDAPRCFAERHSFGTKQRVAMQLTMVPKISLPPILEQEYLFLIDRSGSMEGDRIEVAKRTLQLLVRMLPRSRTKFNIISFGNNCTALWAVSEDYTMESLAHAINHVHTIHANYGGTEIRSAVDKTLRKRRTSIPTVLFVLTDGQAYEADETFALIRREVSSASQAAPLRVFSHGIGDTASTDMVEGIARAGNGECLMAISAESIAGKCFKLFQAGRSSYVEDITIDWGVPLVSPDTMTLPSTVNFSNTTTNDGPRRILLAPPPALQQAPHVITKLHSGLRFVVFALTEQTHIPKQVVVRGRFNGGAEPFELVVPVSTTRPFGRTTFDMPLIHTLAARRLITDLVESTRPLPPAVDPAALTEDIKISAIIRLGTVYQLASEHTSFVAVDAELDPLTRSRMEFERGREQARNAAAKDRGPITMRDIVDNVVITTAGKLYSAAATVLSFLFGPSALSNVRERKLPGAYPSSPEQSRERGRRSPSPPRHRREVSRNSADTFTSISTLASYSSQSSRSPSPTRISKADAERMRSPSPVMNFYRDEEGDGAGMYVPASAPAPVPPAVLELVQLQSFDGSFACGPELAQVVGPVGLTKPDDAIGDDRTWGTALAVAYLRKTLAGADLVEILDAFLDKVNAFVDASGISRSEFAALVNQAKVYV